MTFFFEMCLLRYLNADDLGLRVLMDVNRDCTCRWTAFSTTVGFDQRTMPLSVSLFLSVSLSLSLFFFLSLPAVLVRHVLPSPLFCFGLRNCALTSVGHRLPFARGKTSLIRVCYVVLYLVEDHCGYCTLIVQHRIDILGHLTIFLLRLQSVRNSRGAAVVWSASDCGAG